MDLVRLCQLVGDVLDGLASTWTQREIGPECERLGLLSPPPAGEGPKRERVNRSLAALADAGLPMVAERILAGTMPLSSGPAARYAIEDVLWADRGPEIPRRARREIAQDLDISVLARQGDRFMALLESLWLVDDPLDWITGGSAGSASRFAFALLMEMPGGRFGLERHDPSVRRGRQGRGLRRVRPHRQRGTRRRRPL